MTNIKKLLENRHRALLEWVEPWPACGPEGNDLSAHITSRATIHDCINIQRLNRRENGILAVGDDERALRDFIESHWATLVEGGCGGKTQR